MLKYFVFLFFSMMFITNSYRYHLEKLKDQFNQEIKMAQDDIDVLSSKWKSINKAEELKKMNKNLKKLQNFNPKKEKF